MNISKTTILHGLKGLNLAVFEEKVVKPLKLMPLKSQYGKIVFIVYILFCTFVTE